MFNSTFVLIIVYSIVLCWSFFSFSFFSTFIRAPLVIHDSTRSLFFKPQMTVICHICLCRRFQTILCICTCGALCIFIHRLKIQAYKTFEFTIIVLYRFVWPSFCSLLRFIFIFISHVFACWRYLIKIFILWKFSVKTHCNPFSFDITSSEAGSNVQSLFSVRLFLYHFIYLKLLWLVFIDAVMALCVVALCHTATRNISLLYRRKYIREKRTFISLFHCRFFYILICIRRTASEYNANHFCIVARFHLLFAQSLKGAAKMYPDDMNGFTCYC